MLSNGLNQRKSAGIRVRRGFTLIEIMIVIGIMAVVMAIGIPQMYRTMEKDSIRRATQDVLDVFQLARRQAIIKGQPVQLVIRPRDQVFMVMPLGEAELSEQEYIARELETSQRQGEPEPPVQNEGTMRLSDRIRILFLGVNFVPDLQELDMVGVRFYPNGTSDEFSMLITSDRNESRLFQLDVPTALLNWKAP
jgi:type II secretion system protein H